MAADGVDVIVMDDGLQNPSLLQDLRIIVADGEIGFGNGRPIPAGPLREQVAAGIARADALIVMGEDRCHLIKSYSNQIKCLQATVTSRDSLLSSGRPLLAFAGIGRPEKFRTTLIAAGANIAAFHAFGDHHPYSESELKALAADATQLSAELVTTEKDWMRLTAEWRSRIKAIEIDVLWRDEAVLTALLDGILKSG